MSIRKSFLVVLLLTIFVLTCKKENEPNPETEYLKYEKGEGVIGSGGGKITLNDPNSPLNGASIEIPQGALSNDIEIMLKLDNDKTPTSDPTVDILDLQPNGIIFNKPVKISIPYHNISKPQLFYFLPDSDAIEQVYYNVSQGYIKAEVTHFSRYFVSEEKYGTFDAFLYKTPTGLKANVQFGGINNNGDITLSWIPVKALYALSCGFNNVLDHINNCASNWGTMPNAYHAHIRVELKEGALLFPNTLKTIEYEIRRVGPNVSNLAVRIKRLVPDNKVIYESGTLNAQEREAFFSGKALVFDFGVQPLSDKNYYLELTYYFAQDPTIEVKMTTKYKVNTYKKYDPWTTSNFLTTEPDKDNDCIIDAFDLTPNGDPPIVKTTTPTSFNSSKILTGGVITGEGSKPVTARGVCWSTNQNPTISIPSNITTDGNGSGSFVSTITGLVPNVTYYIRAYATSSVSTSYGDQVSIKTNSIPILTTKTINSVTLNRATITSEITSDCGAPVTARGICWGTSQNPSTSDPLKTTSDGVGIGLFTTYLTELVPNTTYYIRSYAINSEGTAYSEQKSFTTSLVSTGLFLSDYDGNSYNTIKIGNQWWMSENLRTTHYNNGDLIETTNPPDQEYTLEQINLPLKFQWASGGNESNVSSYGRLYTWYAVMDERKVCPTGWKVPSDADWQILFDFLGGNQYAGGLMKEGGYVHWQSPNTGATNQSGFSAVPAGARGVNAFAYPSHSAYHWSSTEKDNDLANQYELSYSNQIVKMTSIDKLYGISVRCVLSNSTSPSLPIVSTSAYKNLSYTSANCGGNITFEGGSAILARGVCWSTNQIPTVTNDKTSDGTGTGLFVSSLSGLLSNTTYYLRAYSTNSDGTSYGDQISFKTIAKTTPIVSTKTVTNITSNSVSCSGDVTNDGGSSVTSRGICWSINSNPTTLNNKISVGSGNGTFSGNITGLQSGTLYYMRAYAINTIGTAYGTIITFTTLDKPKITTLPVSLITSTSATSGGIVSFDGGDPIITKGICWSNVSNPTTSDSKTTDGEGNGNYTSNLTNLTPGTGYHIRAYATNSVGTAYGADIPFSTNANLPSVSTTTLSNITSTTAISGGNVTDDGGSVITYRGVCWSSLANPTISDSKTTNGEGSGVFISSITGLTPGAIYHIRAYASNSIGTAYGADITFSAVAILPSITTSPITGITTTSAMSGGSINSDGGSAITIKGVCWSISINPTITLITKTTDGSGNGSYTSNITNLTPGTVYHIRAYASNSIGTAYGADIEFSANATLPTVTTTIISEITGNTAISGGIVTNDGGSTVIGRGICWSTSHNPTINNNQPYDGSGTGSFVSSLTNLNLNTRYYCRAYAINSIGTSYGNEVSFTTLNVPILTTNPISAVTMTSAISGGTITLNNDFLWEKGVCWSLSPNPTIADSRTSDGFGNNSFISNISGLIPGHRYYVRAYATNSTGTGYGEEVTFITQVTYIGAEYAGGIVFYIDPTGQHGLVCAQNDQSTSAEWGCYGTTIIGADGTSVGTGYQNTIDIINGCNTAGTAAKICFDLTLNGYNDWFLPSKDELITMGINLKENGLGNFKTDYVDYWSSSETSSGNAWVYNFTYNYPYTWDDKAYPGYVRAIRAF